MKISRTFKLTKGIEIMNTMVTEYAIVVADQLRFAVELALRSSGMNCRVRYGIDHGGNSVVLRLAGQLGKSCKQYPVRVEELITLSLCDWNIMADVAMGIADRIREDLSASTVYSPLFKPCDVCEESRMVDGSPCHACIETVS